MKHVHIRREVARQAIKANHAVATDRSLLLDVRGPRVWRRGGSQAFEFVQFVIGERFVAHSPHNRRPRHERGLGQYSGMSLGGGGPGVMPGPSPCSSSTAEMKPSCRQ